MAYGIACDACLPSRQSSQQYAIGQGPHWPSCAADQAVEMEIHNGESMHVDIEKSYCAPLFDVKDDLATASSYFRERRNSFSICSSSFPSWDFSAAVKSNWGLRMCPTSIPRLLRASLKYAMLLPPLRIFASLAPMSWYFIARCWSPALNAL